MENKEIQYLCYAAFSGSITADEREKLARWLEEAPANRAEYDRLMEECLHIRWAQQELTIDVEASKKAIREGIARRDRKRLMRRTGLSTAAAVVAAVALWFAVSDKDMARDDVGIISTRAMLVLSDGTQVEVGGMKGRIVEQDGWRITATADDVLEYEQVGTPTDNDAEPIYNRIRVPRGGEFYIKLGDGTEVWINSDSELEYPLNFAADTRETSLRGEAYFKVRHDSERPFIVRSGDFSMRVYGTEFNLNTYSPEKFELVLVEGSVGFNGKQEMAERMLSPNHLAVIDTGTGEAEVSEVYVRKYVAGKNDELIFRDEPLESVMEKLGRLYNVDVVFENDAVRPLRFDVNMRRYESIASLFYYFEKISDVNFRLDGGTVYIN